MRKTSALFFVFVCLLGTGVSNAQLLLPAANSPAVITFTGFTGAGFQPAPAPGQLSSDTWAVNGMSDGALAFGGTMNAVNSDFTRGVNNGGAATGGLYAFDINGDTTLGIQPIATDFTPGDLILKMQNTTGAALTELYFTYHLWVNNDQDRSNSFDFSWSADNLAYTAVPALAYASGALADTLSWQLTRQKVLLTGLNIANNGFIYIKWHGDDQGGTGSRDEFAVDSIMAVAQPQPIADFFIPPGNCGAQVVCPVNNSASYIPVASWAWSFGDGGISGQQNPCHTYAGFGPYTITLTVTDIYGHTNMFSQNILIQAPPVIMQVSNPNPVCVGSAGQYAMQVQVVAPDMPMSDTWDFGEGGSPVTVPSGTNATYTYSTAGNYNIQACSYTMSGCSVCTTFAIAVNKPAAAFTYNGNVCGKDTIFFSDASTGNGANVITSWSWDLGDLSTSALQNPTHVYSTAGSYIVNLVVTDNMGCTDTITKTLNVGAKPVAAIATSDTCFGAPMKFTDQSTLAFGNIVTRNWAFGDGNVSASQDPQHTYATPGQYTVVLIVTSDAGCKDTAFQVITVAPAIVAGFTFSLNGNVVSYTSSATGGVPGYTYSWDFGDGLQSTQANPVHTYNIADPSYEACLTVYDSFGCSDSVCKLIFPSGISSSAGGNTVLILPNPSTDGIFNITAKGATSITVNNLVGEQVLVQEFRNGLLDLSKQAAGVYYLQVRMNDGSCIQKKLILNK